MKYTSEANKCDVYNDVLRLNSCISVSVCMLDCDCM